MEGLAADVRRLSAARVMAGLTLLDAVLASPDGPLAVDPHWAFCTASKPPTEDNAVATPCTLGDQLVDLGTGSMVTGTLPKDGCILFGPDTPPGGFRPRDADSKGGYY